MSKNTRREFVVPRARIGRAPLLINKEEGKWLHSPKKSLLTERCEPKGIVRSHVRRCYLRAKETCLE